MHVLDIFSGVGGFGLGLERAGMEVSAFCESDAFCRRVLRAHWPTVPIYRDIRELGAERLRADGIAPALVCGGWPCQDLSLAGNGAGLEGERSGLWREFARLLGELRPRWALMENVPALLVRGFGRILGDLAALGFDAEWHCVPASVVGAPHRRDRLWIIAHADVAGRAQQWRGLAISEEIAAIERGGWWRAEPAVGRLADGLSSRLARSERVAKLEALGNAVVPQIVEALGRAILRQEEAWRGA